MKKLIFSLLLTTQFSPILSYKIYNAGDVSVVFKELITKADSDHYREFEVESKKGKTVKTRNGYLSYAGIRKDSVTVEVPTRIKNSIESNSPFTFIIITDDPYEVHVYVDTNGKLQQKVEDEISKIEDEDEKENLRKQAYKFFKTLVQEKLQEIKQEKEDRDRKAKAGLEEPEDNI